MTFSAGQEEYHCQTCQKQDQRENQHWNHAIDRGETCFQIFTSSLSHSLDLNFRPFEKLLSSYLLSVVCGFRNLLNVSAVLAYGQKKEKKKVLYLKFQENWRSHSTSNSWTINTCGSPVRLITKSIFHFQHIWRKKRHAIRKHE